MAETGMIERAALRIWHERAKHFGEPAKPFVKDERWELCLSYARAAVEALREPDLSMVFCGVADLYKTDDPEQEVITVWKSMLSALLKEEGE